MGRLLWSLALPIHLHLLSLLFSSSILLTNCSPSVHHECHEYESHALLQFKDSFVITKNASNNPSGYPKTKSWMPNTDCCSSWDGVECNSVTGHVIGIDLSSSQLYGSIHPRSTLFSLVHLHSLDLSDNDFNYSQIPAMIGELSQLTYLNLSQFDENTFSGEVPTELSKLSNLLSLDLSSYTASASAQAPADPITQLRLNVSTLGSLIQNATRIEEINLDFVTISSSIPDILMNLTHLRKLSLCYCDLYGEFTLEKFLKFKMLTSLVLSENRLSLLIDKSYSNNATLPPPIQVLRLAKCNLTGEIPSWVMNLTDLTSLNFYWNHLHGEIPHSFFGLENLEHISLMANSLQGQLELDLFLKLRKLNYLSLSYNRLTLLTRKSSSNVTLLPPIQTLALDSCNLTGEIPPWIFNLSLSVLSVQENNLEGIVPHSLFRLENLTLLSLNSNLLEGELELDLFLKLKNLTYLCLSSNKLSLLSGNGSSNATLHSPPLEVLDLTYTNLIEFPTFIRYLDELAYLGMSVNDLGSSLPSWMWRKTSLQDLDISASSLTGEIPPSICNLTSLVRLDLSDNNLSGTIPSCLGNFSQSLQILLLQGNKFSGPIPQEYMKRSALRMIDLSNNNLQGQLPRAWVNCQILEYVDMSHNQINDSFPFWLGSLPELKVIALRYNKFHGAIYCIRRCTFPKLHILDLSHNEFSGSLSPETFNEWKSFTTADTSQLQYLETIIFYKGRTWFSNVRYSIAMSNKGLVLNYDELQTKFYAMIAIDLSGNKISGEIPKIMGDLKSLVMLNLSNNMFIGSIPSSLGNLSNLQSLDLSLNILSGMIPQELTKITFLEFFNVSYNKLSGPIPENNQFSTFEGTSFEGNPGLCGIQLLRKCEDHARPPPSHDDEEDDDNSDSSYFFESYLEVILIGYGGGLLVGLILGSLFSSDMYGWFKRFFFFILSLKPRFWT